MKTLIYKGYHGSIDVCVADNVLHGKILFINDLVTYEADTPAALKMEFEAAVDDYIETCRSIKKSPDKTFTGQFNVRIGEELHKRAALRGLQDGVSLNAVVVNALTEYLDVVHKRNHLHNHHHEVMVTVTALTQQTQVWGSPLSKPQFILSGVVGHGISKPH